MAVHTYRSKLSPLIGSIVRFPLLELRETRTR